MKRVLLILALCLLGEAAMAQNIIPVPSFPSNYATTWDTSQSGAWSHDAGNDTTGGDGSAQCTATEPVNCILGSACFTVAPSTTYGYGVRMMQSNVSGLGLSAQEFPTADCSGFGQFINLVTSFGPFSAAFATYSSTATTTGTALSMLVFYTASATFGSGSTVSSNFDGAFFGVGLVPVELTEFSVE